MDLLTVLEFFLLCVVRQTFSAFLESRNLFTERACCRRESYVIFIGNDVSGSPVNVDVGMCRTQCGQSTHSTSLEAGMRATKYSSMLEFLRNKKMRRLETTISVAGEAGGLPSCGSSRTCAPAVERVERRMLGEGLREVEVILDCQCEIKTSQCVRAPALKTFFSQTPYETVIDTGKCVGLKGAPDGFSCVPTKFDSTLIKTPNSSEHIRTVAQCKRVQGCFRVPHLELHPQITFERAGERVESLREIDVGRCLGSCMAGGRCLLRSESQECLLWAEGLRNSCGPHSHKSHTFLNPQGQIRTVLAITSCLCQS